MPNCALRHVYGSVIAQQPTVRRITEPDSQWGMRLRVIEGHTDAVLSVMFSPDGRYIVTGSLDGTVRTWDVGTGAALNIMKGHSDRVTGVSFSPDCNNRQIASASHDCTLRIWDFASGAPLHVIRPDIVAATSDWVNAVAYSPNGKCILSVSDSSDNTVCLWNAVDNDLSEIKAGSRVFSARSGPRRVRSVAFSPDGSMAVTTCVGSDIHIWDVNNGQLFKTFYTPGHVQDAAFTLDGRRVVAGDDLNAVQVWDVESGTCSMTLKGHTLRVSSIAVSKDLIASGAEDSTIRLWDVTSYQLLRVLKDHMSGVTSLSFSLDGRKLASASWDKTVRIWEIADRGIRTTVGHDSEVTSLAFSGDGTRVATGSKDKSIAIWETRTGKRLQTFNSHSDKIWCLSFSPDRQRLISGEEDNLVIIRNIETGNTLMRLEAFRGSHPGISAVACSPDGKWIACGSNVVGSRLQIWRALDGSLMKTIKLKPSSRRIGRLEFSPDSAKIHADITDFRHKHEPMSESIWNVSTGEALNGPGHSWELAHAKEAFKVEGQEGGWILLKRSNKKLCWLTGSKRAYWPSKFGSFGDYCACGAGSGQVTILDLSELVDHAA